MKELPSNVVWRIMLLGRPKCIWGVVEEDICPTRKNEQFICCFLCEDLEECFPLWKTRGHTCKKYKTSIWCSAVLRHMRKVEE